MSSPRIRALSISTASSDAGLLAAPQDLGEHFQPCLLARLQVVKAEGLTEPKTAWADFAVGWRVL